MPRSLHARYWLVRFRDKEARLDNSLIEFACPSIAPSSMVSPSHSSENSDDRLVGSSHPPHPPQASLHFESQARIQTWSLHASIGGLNFVRTRRTIIQLIIAELLVDVRRSRTKICHQIPPQQASHSVPKMFPLGSLLSSPSAEDFLWQQLVAGHLAPVWHPRIRHPIQADDATAWCSLVKKAWAALNSIIGPLCQTFYSHAHSLAHFLTVQPPSRRSSWHTATLGSSLSYFILGFVGAQDYDLRLPPPLSPHTDGWPH